jgi:hypothetical protein
LLKSTLCRHLKFQAPKLLEDPMVLKETSI